jgi:RNA polymerase sigma-70 factor (family 1)
MAVINKNLYEKALLEKLRLGDKDIFSLIFSTHYQDLVTFAVTILGDFDKAEEIVQDVFVKLWEEHNTIIIKSSLKSYMLKIVQNKCIDWIRHVKVIQKYNSEVIENHVIFEHSTDSYLLKSELEDLIKDALSILPPEVTETFRMSRDEGLKYYEIAEKLNVSVSTIEVRIGKALDLLRYHLKDYLK